MNSYGFLAGVMLMRSIRAELEVLLNLESTSIRMFL